MNYIGKVLEVLKEEELVDQCKEKRLLVVGLAPNGYPIGLLNLDSYRIEEVLSDSDLNNFIESKFSYKIGKLLSINDVEYELI